MTTTNTLGDTIFESPPDAAYVALNGPDASLRIMRVTTAGANRWLFGGSDDAESGQDGTDYIIQRFSALGLPLNTFRIDRNTGLATFYQQAKIGGTSGFRLKSDGSGNMLLRNAGDSAASNLTIADLAAVTGTFTGKLNTAASTLTLSSFKLTPGVAPTSNMVEGDFYYDSTAHVPYVRNNSAWVALLSGGVAPAPSDATYIVQTASSNLSAEQSLGALTSGIVYNTVTSTTGVLSIATGAQMIAGFATQTANTVFSGPTTGADATPAFRALVAADIPNLAASKITTGQLALARGGTNADLSGTGGANQVLKQSSSGATITVAALIAADIPSLAASIITSGQLALARGGTNADLSATGAANSFLKQSSSGAAVTVGTIATADIATALTTPGPIGSGTASTVDATSITTSTSTPLIMTYVANGAGWNALVGKRALAGPTAVTAGTELFSLNANPYNGSAYATGTARILAGAAETHGGSAAGTYLDFYTTLAGGTTTRRALLIQHDGSFQTTAITTDTNVIGDTYLTLRSSTGTPAAGFGAGFVLRLDSSTNAAQYASRWRALWVVATNASRTARAILSVFDTAERDCIRIEASGSAGMIGFLGAAAVTRPTVTGSRGANAAVASAMTALANLGLITDSTTV